MPVAGEMLSSSAASFSGIPAISVVGDAQNGEDEVTDRSYSRSVVIAIAPVGVGDLKLAVFVHKVEPHYAALV